MPRPQPELVTFEIDGREVTAPEGTMLVDAAKQGDVEIPYFCYEPKLGAPVGACRMCLVEIEGIPKLQTSCSTPVKDGMVVTTTSDRVQEAQNAVVEFLLVNHPLDCPVCDKGGECPLQDISYGWGAGRSRFIEPKRHFKKPLELSPLVAIDRERCILCYRCVRFSQEIAEDYQLVFLERGDHTYVGTHDGRPYVAPFSGNIIELCPVGALTSRAYRFRARPWDIEGAGSVCTLCPSQCNVEFTVRDDAKVLRVLARDNEEVDDGWLCDKGRFGYQAVHSEQRVTAPMLRQGDALRETTWEQALDAAATALESAGERTAALVGGESTNEEGFLAQHLLRQGLGSPHVESRTGAQADLGSARALAQPEHAARVSDIDYAGAVLVIETELVEESPILDLRVRKAHRRNDTRIVVLTSRPSSLDADADVVRIAPGGAEAALAALAAALGSARAPGGAAALAAAAGADAGALQAAAATLRGAESVVTLWGERLTHGQRGHHAASALLAVAETLRGADSGLIEVPAGTNSRGLREVGCLPCAGPGLSNPTAHGLPAMAMAAALSAGELSALLLLHSDPLHDQPGRPAWEAALEGAESVVAFADFVSEGLAAHADVVFPAASYVEREGTVTHPDGRLQRVRQAIGHPGQVRPAAAVLNELCERTGAALGVPLTETIQRPYLPSVPALTAKLVEAVPFYAGITLDEIGGRGVRWQDRDAAASAPEAPALPERLADPPSLPAGMRLGAVPSLWTGRETEHAEALRFLAPSQRAELAPADASRLGVASGDEVEVAVDGQAVRATAAVRTGVQEGSVFLIAGTAEGNAHALTNGAPRTVEVRRP